MQVSEKTMESCGMVRLTLETFPPSIIITLSHPQDPRVLVPGRGDKAAPGT